MGKPNRLIGVEEPVGLTRSTGKPPRVAKKKHGEKQNTPENAPGGGTDKSVIQSVRAQPKSLQRDDSVDILRADLPGHKNSSAILPGNKSIKAIADKNKPKAILSNDNPAFIQPVVGPSTSDSIGSGGPEARDGARAVSGTQLEIVRCRVAEWKPSPIAAVAGSGDGSVVAVAREDGSIELWRTAAGAVGWALEQVRETRSRSRKKEGKESGKHFNNLKHHVAEGLWVYHPLWCGYKPCACYRAEQCTGEAHTWMKWSMDTS